MTATTNPETAQSMPLATNSSVDVLIVGAGPAGYMAALWFSRLGVNARIIDKRSAKIFTGQADGLQPRAMEVFNSFGFADRALKEINQVFEYCYYQPDATGKLKRVDRKAEGSTGVSRFEGGSAHQGNIEQWFTDAIHDFSQGTLKVERPLMPESLKIDESQMDNPDAFPVVIKVKRLSDLDADPEQFGHKVQNGLYRQFNGDNEREFATSPESLETIRAKYVIGTDGAHSWVRKQLGIVPEGESTDHVWGVLDIVPITDFPDIRKRCAIHSADGSIMIVPRENGMIRFYTQLKDVAHEPETGTGGAPGAGVGGAARVDRSKITADLILETARKIMQPYTLNVASTSWFTGYQIGQRIAPKFEKLERIFIAGDACHTHSPKAGQGMNISMMDTFNIAWKIAHVIQKKAKPSILSTYEQERRQVAQELIDYDFELSRLFSTAASAPQGSTSTDKFRDFIAKGAKFTTGCTVDYNASLLIRKPPRDDISTQYASPLAIELKIGMRIPDAKFVMQCDSRPWFFQDRLPSNGSWRVINFTGDFSSSPGLAAQLVEVGQYFSSSKSFIKRYTPEHVKFDSVIELLLVHACDTYKVEWDDFPLAFRPREQSGAMDYWKILGDFESLQGGTSGGYKAYGISKEVGALVVLRPDGYVAMVTTPDVAGVNEVEGFFEAFLIPA